MPKPKSASDRVYRQLLDELVTCRLRPGDRILTEPLRLRFGVSFTVVREALARLAAEGFAVADPQRGFTVAQISAQDLLALTEARIGVEALCIRDALERAGKEWEAQIITECDAVLSTPIPDPIQPGRISEQFLAAHDRFHNALISTCTNPWLIRVRNSLTAQASRYLQICIPREPDLPRPDGGFADITAAAIARDADRTVNLIAGRFRRNAEDFVKVLESPLKTRFWHEVDHESA